MKLLPMAEDRISWHPKRRNYALERREFALERTPARTHPLLSTGKKLINSQSSLDTVKGVPNGSSPRSLPSWSRSNGAVNSAVKTSGFIDPLSQMAGNMEVAPLRGDTRKGNSSSTAMKQELLGPWASKKEAILSRFTTTEKLTLISSYLSGDDRVVTVAKSNLVSDKIQNRLEQLDNFEAGSMKEMLNLSQHEYVNKIDQLHTKLQSAWRDDHRVTALKIAIQLAKLLSDTAPLQFYPSKFALVTDVLETFGQLIYDRIADKSANVFGDKSPDLTPETAKETCRNWFYKVASIRELLPRLYIEISIMRCQTFLEPKTAYMEVIPRLAGLIRGIGDHLVATYLRCYLARMILQLAPETMPKFVILIEDFVVTAQSLQRDKLVQSLREQKLTLSSYLLLYQPALEWVIDCYGRLTGAAGMDQLLTLAESSQFSGLVLNCVMTSFKADLVAHRPMQICALIHSSNDEVFPSYILCRTLGLCLLGADTDQKDRKRIMNEIWPIIVDLKEPQHYVSAAEVWVEFTAKFFTVKEVNRILGDIISHLLPDRAYESCPNVLVQILEKLIRHLRSFSLMLSMDKFMPYLDMLQKEDVKLEAAKMLLEAHAKYDREETTSDAVLLNGIMFASKAIHDAITSLSSDDERRVAANTICACLRRVNFGKDFEHQLTFYAECRGLFSNLDDVAEFLIRSVNHLAMSTLAIQNGHHSRKTAAFVRACVAFSFITVPSLYDIPCQLNLYLECAQVALANQCLGQADALVKAAIQLFNASKEELDGFGSKMRSGARIALDFGCSLLSLMLVMPDPPEQGMLYLMRGIVNTVQGLEVEVRTSFQLELLAFFSAASQEEYLYHIADVDSNDRLYGGDPDFLATIEEMSSGCLSSLLATFQQLVTSRQISQAVKLAFDISQTVITHGQVDQMTDVLAKLFAFLKGHAPQNDPKRLQSWRRLLQTTDRPWVGAVKDLL